MLIILSIYWSYIYRNILINFVLTFLFNILILYEYQPTSYVQVFFPNFTVSLRIYVKLFKRPPSYS